VRTEKRPRRWLAWASDAVLAAVVLGALAFRAAAVAASWGGGYWWFDGAAGTVVCVLAPSRRRNRLLTAAAGLSVAAGPLASGVHQAGRM
jgi:hypothetical protein